MEILENLNILGIESSCDETAAAVVRNGREVLSNIISSQIDLHKKFGGVVPEIASRKHIENISLVVDQALLEADMTFQDIDAVAVTYGPGLVGALLVGLSYGKSLAYAIGKPLVGVHHIEGHISANYIDHKNLEPPFVSLVVSGGHTHLVFVRDYGVYEILGRTRDDAAGEAFDKVARAIGLGYPGGPKIENEALSGSPDKIVFPRATLEEGSLDFSFSGLKSAVLNYINKCRMMELPLNTGDIAAGFQKAVTDVLTEKAVRACELKQNNRLALAGGVACNQALRQSILTVAEKQGIEVFMPQPVYCTDNAAMIACAGYYDYIKGRRDGLDLNAYATLELQQGN